MIITLTGHKNCGSDKIAERFAENSEAQWIQPYTDAPVPSIEPISQKHGDWYHYVSKERLDKMIEKQEVLCCTRIKGHRYVFFKAQLTAKYNVMIVDDYALIDVQDHYKGKIYTIKVKSNNQIESDRIGEYYYDHEFDEVFHYDYDSYDELEARISYGYRE